MSTTRGSSNDRLDAAIDHVAARMVAVPGDDEMTVRIVSALPQRTPGLRWWVPQLAAIGAIVLAALVWTTRQSIPLVVTPLPSSEVAPMIELASAVAREPGTAVRTVPLEPLEHLEPVERLDVVSIDHERSLAPIEAAAALVVPPLAPTEIPATELLAIAPIEVGALPMTAESFSQRK
jgi:hypothetical protein